jgi:FKBP-type peptidyl-prolyl cis-trans isomerase 2
VKGLEAELMKMKVGQKKKITVGPEDALGERNSELIKLVPLSEFKKRDIDPFPGMPIVQNNMRGRVLSVSGGRVKVDFNHPLAGKTLEYEVEIKEKITGVKERVLGILELFVKFEKDEINVKIDKESLEIKIDKKKDVPKTIKKVISENVTKWVKPIKKVRFIEEF